MFSIITPSYNHSAWLQLCIASIADQGMPAEHIVQDPGSTDGTLDWLSTDRRVRAFIEKDHGMYDAINRGVRHSNGDLLAWLNCDEQYLPGSLSTVSKWFDAHPDIDVLFGDVVIVDQKGSYICHRKMQIPSRYHTWTCHLSTLSCGMFFRRSLLADRGFWFNEKLRDVGDGEWMVRLLTAGVKMGTLGQFTSVFTRTGANMSVAPNALQENLQFRGGAPAWARAARPLLILHHRLRRLLGGMYRQRPFAYDIYTLDSPMQRRRFTVQRPRGTNVPAAVAE